MRRKPICSHAAPTASATRRVPAASPARYGSMSITGIAVAAMLTLPLATRSYPLWWTGRRQLLVRVREDHLGFQDPSTAAEGAGGAPLFLRAQIEGKRPRRRQR